MIVELYYLGSPALYSYFRVRLWFRRRYARDSVLRDRRLPTFYLQRSLQLWGRPPLCAGFVLRDRCRPYYFERSANHEESYVRTIE